MEVRLYAHGFWLDNPEQYQNTLFIFDSIQHNGQVIGLNADFNLSRIRELCEKASNIQVACGHCKTNVLQNYEQQVPEAVRIMLTAAAGEDKPKQIEQQMFEYVDAFVHTFWRKQSQR